MADRKNEGNDLISLELVGNVEDRESRYREAEGARRTIVEVGERKRFQRSETGLVEPTSKF
ncbi:hypothetical protein ACLOJK_004097 [Asimina triloba]